jgi:hypothetical protein
LSKRARGDRIVHLEILVGFEVKNKLWWGEIPENKIV